MIKSYKFGILNLEKLDKCNFHYLKQYRSLYELKEEASFVLINENNIEAALNFYFSHMSNKKFYFSPSLFYFKKWISLYPSYIVYKENEIIGLFSYKKETIWYPSLNTKIINGSLLLCIGLDIEFVIKQCISTGKKYFDILKFFEIGDVSSKNLNNFFAQKSYLSYVNFFNITLFLNASDFYGIII